MENEIYEHFVEFDKYCDICKFKECKDIEGQEPCNECLTNPVNLESKRPVKFEEKEEEEKK